MKGVLRKTEKGWLVDYMLYESLETLPLHPDDEMLMVFRGQILNNKHIMDGRISDFEIVQVVSDKGGDNVLVNTYAKIIINEIFAQQEISDEQIIKSSKDYYDKTLSGNGQRGFIDGAKWYREHLKKTD